MTVLPSSGPTEPAQAVVYTPRLTAVDAALLAARVAGCTCDPEVVIRGGRATVRHDDWCPLIRAAAVN